MTRGGSSKLPEPEPPETELNPRFPAVFDTLKLASAPTLSLGVECTESRILAGAGFVFSVD